MLLVVSRADVAGMLVVVTDVVVDVVALEEVAEV
jgi:hypothetical protein